MQDYTYSSTTSTNDPGAVAAILAFIMGYFIFLVIVYLVACFILSKVFVKAGKPAWAAYVPIYNGWILFEIGGKPGWWILAGLIPFVGPLILFVLTIIISLEIAKKFGKSPTFGIVGLWLFSIIGYAMLAFDDSKYQVGSKPLSTTENTPTANNDPTTPPSLVQ